MNDSENKTKINTGTETDNNPQPYRPAAGGAAPASPSALLEMLDYVEIFVFSVCAVILLFTFVLRVCRVDGLSMYQTLDNGDVLIVSDILYTPSPGDIIVFHQTSDIVDDYNKPMVKRVIATAGQHVKIDFASRTVYVSDDAVFDDSDIIDESDYVYFDRGYWTRGGVYEAVVPEGYIFVMGDNRNNSADSLDTRIGFIDTRRIIGKVLIRIMPFDKFGYVE